MPRWQAYTDYFNVDVLYVQMSHVFFSSLLVIAGSLIYLALLLLTFLQGLF